MYFLGIISCKGTSRGGGCFSDGGNFIFKLTGGGEGAPWGASVLIGGFQKKMLD